MRRTSLLVLLGLAPAAALAQSTSDLMPTPPPAPAGGGAIVYPGAPVPAPSGGAARNPIRSGPAGQAGNAPGGEAPKGRTGYDIYEGTEGLFENDDGRVSRSTTAAIPETHVVKKGDTLWGISGYYFSNPWYWPKLWSFNPSITNPHWIYPGDVVRLLLGGAAPEPTPVAAAIPERPRAPARADGIFLRQTGFLEPDELKKSGTIIASKEEKLMLGTLDEAYVQLDKEHPLRIGERYTVYRPLNDVKHPVTHKKVGTLVQILGEAEVKTITDGKIARCLIVDSTDPIERGFKVGPLRRQFKVVEPVRNQRDLEGVVVTALRPIRMVAADNLMFVDRGKQDGVVVGNRFLITRRGDGFLPLRATGPIDDKRFPREVIGEILVVDVRENLSTGIVLRTIKETNIGDRVEARKNY